jgi:IS5 family transposase
MRPRDKRDRGQNDLFRARLDQIVDMNHALAKLGRQIDWTFLEEAFGSVYPYYQLFCGEEFFRHKLPFERTSITRWRQRMGEERITALIQESLNVATRIGAARPQDFTKIIVDTTVQPKNVMFPTDAKLTHRALMKLVWLARKHGVKLRQTYVRVAKYALIAHQRYAHAKQFKRATKALRKLRTYLGRVIRDIVRRIAGTPVLQEAFAQMLSLAQSVRHQRQRQRGKKIYSLHAPEVECIGKGKAHRPYEFGVKVSIATTLNRSAGGQFIAHAKALPGNPYDGHTLATVIPDIQKQIGANINRIVADKGYRGHNAPADWKYRIYISGQKRGVIDAIKRDLRRRSAIEPVIGHAKSEHRMDRNYLKGSNGDAINAVLAAAGYNFRRLLAWLKRLLRVWLTASLDVKATNFTTALVANHA